MKRIVLVISLLLMTSTAWGEGLSVGLTANNRVVGAECGFLTSSPFGAVEVAGGVTYNKDRYTITNGLVSVKSDSLSPGLRYGLGFKYVMGSVKNKPRTEEGDLSAIGFNLELSYELPATINPSSTPIELIFDTTLSPESISFDETESYMDFTSGLKIYLIENAYVSVTHTYLNMEFENGGRTWDRYINETMVGIVLSL